MKNAEEKLRFKNHFFKLGQGRLFPPNECEFWEVFWKEPDTSNDIYELLTVYDIKTIRDQNKANFIMLIRILCTKIVKSADDEAFPSSMAASVEELINCIRFVTKLIPFLYEMPDYLEELEDKVFWSDKFNPLELIIKSEVKNEAIEKKSTTQNILGIKLMRSLINLLFIKGFTVNAPISSKHNKFFTVWEPGIGSTSKYQTPNIIIDSNRSEVLKLILTLCSNSFYQLPSQIVSNGSKFLTLLVTSTPRVELLTLVCSLINLVCRSARSSPTDNVLIYNNMQLTEMRHLCVTYSIQLLTLMIVYPLPSSTNLQFLTDLDLISTSKPYNMVRLYLGKLHKENELLFLGSYLINILRLPLKDPEYFKFSLNKSSNQSSLWATESAMLLWELMQCNKNFKALIGEQFLDELIIIMLYYILTFHNVNNQKNLVRICSYFILYLSSDTIILEKLFDTINPSFYESLPITFKTNPSPVTSRDFIITQICSLLTNSSSSTYSYNASNKGINDLLVTTLVEILYNLIPPISSKELQPTNDPARKLNNTNPNGGLSYATCSAITQLIAKFSTRSFLLENSFNADLLALIFRAICTAIVKYPKPSRMLLFSILKNEKVYEQVWNTVYSFSSEYFSGNTLKLNCIEDNEDNNCETETLPLSKVESHRSDQLSIISSPIVDSDLSESIFVKSLSDPGSNSNLIMSNCFSQSPENELDQFENEIEAIDAALRPRLPTGMSQKAREKLPKGAPLKRTWGGNDSLRIILTITIPHLKLVLKEVWSSREGSSIDSFVLVKHIENIDFEKLISDYKSQINYDFLPDNPLEPLKFNWSQLSLGWYLSLLYSNMYNSVANVKSYTGTNNKIIKNLTNSLASISKLTSSWTSFTRQTDDIKPTEDELINKSLTSINHWAHTSIKLFKIESIHNEGFFGSINKLSSQAVPGTPGGVNDMANNLVRRFSDFRINSNNRTNISSNSSVLNTPIEEQNPTFGNYPRNSITSLHSLNTLNRSRSNTPRNSFSM